MQGYNIDQEVHQFKLLNLGHSHLSLEFPNQPVNERSFASENFSLFAVVGTVQVTILVPVEDLMCSLIACQC